CTRDGNTNYYLDYFDSW
nr:immunoglobulin heavy chain junction region [Macaca mulatta]MOV39478.1 immunoglobulin heavy chain junction region [Macaca mulatta]MOV40856.1 immunoglobulin heavy chain junction region [Macaca mulatta]MOV41722.1 immunoglobulin heavy chain junction region [Macaca mulatta]MOV44269.1 immunoglobulin heavy chain junction region [Macaca mulatta]